MQVMTPEHPRWREFCDRLGGPEGCDFHEKVEDDGNWGWRCKGGMDKTFAIAILESMNETMDGELDISASLSYFEDRGGHCDCEILFNVDNPFD